METDSDESRSSDRLVESEREKEVSEHEAGELTSIVAIKCAEDGDEEAIAALSEAGLWPAGTPNTGAGTAA